MTDSKDSLKDFDIIKKKVFSTSHRLNVQYKLPAGHTGGAENIFLEEITLTYKFLPALLTSPYDDISASAIETHKKYLCMDHWEKVKLPRKIFF